MIVCRFPDHAVMISNAETITVTFTVHAWMVLLTIHLSKTCALVRYKVS